MRNWHYFSFPEDFDPSELTDRQRGLILAVLRTLAGPESKDALPDPMLLNAAVELIQRGFIEVYIRERKGQLETKIEFPIGAPGGVH